MKRTGTPTAGESSPIPSDLLRSVPRECELTGLGRFAIGASVALALGALIGSVAIYIAATRASELKRAMIESGRVAGVVIKAYRTGGDNKKDVFLYEFGVDGQTYRGRTEIAVSRSPEYRVGVSIPVRYLPSRPQGNWIDGYPPSSVPLFLIPLVSVACIGGALAIVANVRRQRELLTEGRPVLAEVKRIKRVQTGNHKTQQAFVEFALLNGAVREGRIDFRRRVPQLGSTILILYDKENPRRLVRYPASLVRLSRVAS